MQSLKNALALSHQVMREMIAAGSVVVDATVGNGNDTLFFCALVGETGKVYGFDVQPTAIARTQEKLAEIATPVTLICDGHQNMQQHVKEPVDWVGFNLGFLPAGDKSVTTQCATTLTAVTAALDMLKSGGVCSICVYPGHDEGSRERAALNDFLAALDCKRFTVAHYRLVNAPKNPPELFLVQKA